MTQARRALRANNSSRDVIRLRLPALLFDVGGEHPYKVVHCVDMPVSRRNFHTKEENCNGLISPLL